MKKHYFSESALARALGTTRYKLQRELEPIQRAGSTKVYAYDDQEISLLKRKFSSDHKSVCTEYLNGSEQHRAFMIRNPEKRQILLSHLRPQLSPSTPTK